MRAEAAAWRLVVTRPNTGAWNMACDEALGAEVLAGSSPPVVRYFQWNPPTISFGYSQDLAREVDVDAARRDSIGLVRRVTGGRAVLHADEVTYSVICREDDPVAAGGIIATYARISAGLARGLCRLGINAELARASEALATGHVNQATLPCFGSTSRAEIVVVGKKIVGSAQHRMRGLVLQHGSILFGPEHLGLVRYLRVEDAVRRRYLRHMEESTTSLGKLGWRGMKEAAIEALAVGLSEVLGITWADCTNALTQTEERHVERLAEEKYAADWWNFRRQPAPALTGTPS